jgi:hypothetical protein
MHRRHDRQRVRASIKVLAASIARDVASLERVREQPDVCLATPSERQTRVESDRPGATVCHRVGKKQARIAPSKAAAMHLPEQSDQAVDSTEDVTVPATFGIMPKRPAVLQCRLDAGAVSIVRTGTFAFCFS